MVEEDFVLPQTGIRAFWGLNMPPRTVLTPGPAGLVGKARKRNPDFHQGFFFMWIARSLDLRTPCFARSGQFLGDETKSCVCFRR